MAQSVTFSLHTAEETTKLRHTDQHTPFQIRAYWPHILEYMHEYKTTSNGQRGCKTQN